MLDLNSLITDLNDSSVPHPDKSKTDPNADDATNAKRLQKKYGRSFLSLLIFVSNLSFLLKS